MAEKQYEVDNLYRSFVHHVFDFFEANACSESAQLALMEFTAERMRAASRTSDFPYFGNDNVADALE